jgi:O-antigen ligase
MIEVSVLLMALLWLMKRLLSFLRASRSGRFSQIIAAYKPCPTILDKQILCFFLLCFVSVIFSTIFEHSLRGFLTKTLEWLIIFYIFIEVFTEVKYLRAVGIVLVVTSVATGLDSLWQFHVTGQDIFNGRELARGGATAGFHHPNSLAGYLTILLPLSFSFIMIRSTRIKRIGYIIMFCVLFWALIVTFSRSAWMATGLGFFYFLLLSRRKLTLWFLLGSLIMGIGVYSFMPASQRHSSRLGWSAIEYMTGWRMNIWKDTLKMIKDKPFAGHGLNTYMMIFQNYQTKVDDTGKEYNPTYAHNCYLQMTAEIGIPGFLSFVWILISLFRYLNEMFYLAKSQELRMIYVGLGSGIGAFLIHSFFDTHFYSLQLSALLWLAIAGVISLSEVLKEGNICDIKTVN